MTSENLTLTLSPIGFFRCPAQYPYDVPRQGCLAPEATGTIELNDELPCHLALKELDGFSHLWVIFWFHHNNSWRPLVSPPRHREQKVGVFASRSPYRPNPLGLSCVKLVSIDGNRIQVAGHDLLNGTPILDLKPYLPYADAIPDAVAGWTAAKPEFRYAVVLTASAESQLTWLEANGLDCLRNFIHNHLESEPLNARRHRLENRTSDSASLAYRTWRADFTCDDERRIVQVTAIRSGYTKDDLDNPADRYGDKELHWRFIRQQ